MEELRGLKGLKEEFSYALFLKYNSISYFEVCEKLKRGKLIVFKAAIRPFLVQIKIISDQKNQGEQIDLTKDRFDKTSNQ